MISFRKCRKISAVIREILRFQRHAYSFSVDKNAIVGFGIQKEQCILLQEFFLSMNPMEGFADEKELETYLYTQSQIIEPSKCVFKGKT
jgi:hypothetical protein